MKKNFISLSKKTVALLATLIPSLVFADTLSNPLAASDFTSLMSSIAGSAARLGLPVAAVFIIYSGLLFVTARGSEDQIKKARTAFMWSVVGTGILLGAWVIAEAIKTTVQSLGT